MNILVNIDVPELDPAAAFYTEAFGLRVGRRFGDDGVELLGWPIPLYLLRKEAGTIGAGASRRIYDRHWTPVHLDVVVSEIEVAIGTAVNAGAIVETDVQTAAWGKLAILSDPYGHGFCLIEFLNRGYDELVDCGPGTPNGDQAARSAEV